MCHLPSVVFRTVVKLSVILKIFFKPIVVSLLNFNSAVCCSTACQSAMYHNSECHNAKCHSAQDFSIACHFDECCTPDCCPSQRHFPANHFVNAFLLDVIALCHFA